MPVDLRFLDDGAGLLLACHGPVTGDEIIQQNEELLHAPDRLQQLRYAVVDLAAASSFDASVYDAQFASEQDRRIAALVPQLVVVLIAPSDLTFGMARMWEALVEPLGWSTHAFRSKGDADAWLHQEVQRRFGKTMAGRPSTQ